MSRVPRFQMRDTARHRAPVITDIEHIDEYARAHPRDVACIRVADAEKRLAPAPRFAFGPMPDYLTRSLFEINHAGAVGCYIVRNARLAHDAVLLHRQTALWSLSLNHGQDYVRRMLHRAASVTSVRHVSGTAACLFGPGYNVYGHWLVDFLPRLGVLSWAGYDIARLRYILPHDTPNFALEFLRLIGIPAKHLIAHNADREQIEFDELVIPTNLRTLHCLHSLFAEATRFWVGRMLADARETSDSRLFVSRRGASANRVLGNRDAIEQLAHAAGFIIVSPETLPLNEQISLFRSARQIVGEYGSGLHNAIHGSARLHCCALRGTSHWLGFIQSSLADAFGQSASYVFGHADASAISYNFDINPDDFRRALECLDQEMLQNG